MAVCGNRTTVLYVLPDPVLDVLHLGGVIPLFGGKLGERTRKLAEALAVVIIGEEILIGEEALVNCQDGGGGRAVRGGVEACNNLLEGFEGAGNKCRSGSQVLEGINIKYRI